MYQIAICDDDKVFTTEFHEKLKTSLLSHNIEAQIEEFSDTASFLEAAKNGKSFDLLFLDILLDGENGYLFAKRLRKEKIRIDIVFITATEDYAVAGYDAAPLLYLVKPLTHEQIDYAIHIFLQKHVPERVFLRVSGEFLSIAISDILYCEVYGHKTSLYLTSGEVRELRCSLNQLERQLPSSVFVRSHHSYLVNMEYIDCITRYRITLRTGQFLPVSQSRYLDFQNSFIRYAGRNKMRV